VPLSFQILHDQVDELKQQLVALQDACEEQRRLESNAARDIKDVETMLRGM
jgi:hypothetical protein